MSILVVAAHPDDEVLGCGGTIARLTQKGQDVNVAILGEGITSRYAQRDQADKTRVEALCDCSRQVAEMLGVKALFTYDLPDNRFDTVPLLDVIKVVEELVQRVQPREIYTHHNGDLNIDHVVVHRAVLTATRPTVGCPVRDVYAFEVPSSTDWALGQFQPVFQPNVFVDISDVLPAKLQAMALYASETRPFPHPRASEALQATAKRWGAVVGVEYAEAFELLRSLR